MDTPVTQSQILDITKDVSDLQYQMAHHRHIGSDKTQKVSSGATVDSYGGTVASTGSALFLPTGWSSTKTGTGAYTVTHNLNNTNYAVVLTASGGVLSIGVVYTINSNNFTLSFFSSGASLQDTKFCFVLHM